MAAAPATVPRPERGAAAGVRPTDRTSIQRSREHPSFPRPAARSPRTTGTLIAGSASDAEAERPSVRILTCGRDGVRGDVPRWRGQRECERRRRRGLRVSGERPANVLTDRHHDAGGRAAAMIGRPEHRDSRTVLVGAGRRLRLSGTAPGATDGQAGLSNRDAEHEGHSHRAKHQDLPGFLQQTSRQPGSSPGAAETPYYRPGCRPGRAARAGNPAPRRSKTPSRRATAVRTRRVPSATAVSPRATSTHANTSSLPWLAIRG